MSYIKATLDDNTFLFLADKIAQYKQEKFYSRMGVATKALKELMSSLVAMYSSSESEENRRNAEIIILKLVYEAEAFLDRLLALVKVFTPAKMPLSALSNAAEIIHFLLKLLEANAKQLVQKKKRAGRQTDNGREGDDEDDGAHLDQYEMEGLEPEAGGAPGVPAEGIAANVSVFTNLAGAPSDENQFSSRQEEMRRLADETAADREKYFDFHGYLAHFGKYSVVKNYVILLRNYQRNSPRVNHVVVKFFYRIVHTLKLEALLFQTSILRIFDAIVNDVSIALKPEFSELRALADDIAGRVVEMFQTNASALAIQMLFPKTKLEADILMRAKMVMEEEAQGPLAEAEESPALLSVRAAAVGPAADAGDDDEYQPEAADKNDWDLDGMIENEREAVLVRLHKQRELLEEKQRQRAEQEAFEKAKAIAMYGPIAAEDESSLEYEEVLEELEEEIEAEEEALANWTDEQDTELQEAFELYGSLDDPDVNLWEAVSTSVGSATAWQCYRRLQQLGVNLPLAIAPPDMETRTVKKILKSTKKVKVGKKKDRVSADGAAEATLAAQKTSSKKEAEKVKKVPAPRKPRKKSRAVPKDLAEFIIDDSGPPPPEKEAKKGKKKRQRGNGDSNEEEAVSHMSEEESDAEKKGKHSRKRRKTAEAGDENSLRGQLRIGAFEKDNDEADEDDLNVRFVPRRGRLVRQRGAEGPGATDEGEMELDIEDDNFSAPPTTARPAMVASKSKRGAIIDEDDDAPPPVPARKTGLQLQYSPSQGQDQMEVDIADEELESAPASTPSTTKSGGRRVIEDD